MIEYLDKFIRDRKSYCSDRTIEYYKDNLTDFIFWCRCNKYTDIKLLNDDVLRDYILYLRGKKIKNVSVRTYFRSVKAFIRWLYISGYLDQDYTLHLKLPRPDPELIIPLSVQEVKECDTFFIGQKENGLRNFCMFHLMLDCGLRRSEVINLTWDDISSDKLNIVNSKFNKSRIVLLPWFLHESLLNYQKSCSPIHDIYIFHDRYGNKRITINTFRKMFATLKHLPGLERIHAHLCRHTFATSYLYYGGNMEMLRLFMGHADYAILQNYLHLAAVQKLVNQDLYKLDHIYGLGEKVC